MLRDSRAAGASSVAATSPLARRLTVSNTLRLSLVPCLILPLCVSASTATARDPEESDPAAGAARRPNVLFIAVDDLNHWVHHLGRNHQARTPNIDRLASRGVTFTRAYCAAPACNPSRTALMSGLRPSTSGVYANPDDWRKLISPSITLNAHFRRNGYYVAGAGKIYHGGMNVLSEWDDYRDRKKEGAAPTPEGRRGAGGAGAIKYSQLIGDDAIMDDYHVASWVIDELGRKHEKPFFLACGIFRPHLPWFAPQKYFQPYPLEKIELPPFREDDLDDIPAAGVRIARPQGDHANITEQGIWKNAIQGYLASISFADAQVGRVIDALEKSRYKDNTIVVLWGDHGWHLGEKRHWRKFALWEEATRAPFIWVVPGVTRPESVCHRTVDFLSVYPTLCDLCGIDLPEHLEGASIRAILGNPDAEWSAPAVTTHHFQNHAVRTERWRYIRYADGSEELYDHDTDPYEWTNLAEKSELAEVRSRLSNHLPKLNKEPPERQPRQRSTRARRDRQDSGG